MKVVLFLCVLVLLPSFLFAAPLPCIANMKCIKTEGASCSATNVCDATMYCDSSNKCRNRKPIGGSCSNNDQGCVVRSNQQGGSVRCSAAQNGVCSLSLVIGAPCSNDDECAGNYYCNKNGLCDGLKLGEPCFRAQCGIGLYCNETSQGVGSKTCIPQRKEGGACWIAATNNCEPGLHCVNNDTKNAVLSVCLPFGARPLGGICGEAEDCEPGLYCTGNVNSPGKCAQVTYVPTNTTCDPYDNNFCAKNVQARCDCVPGYSQTVCTGPETETADYIADLSYFRLCAVTNKACHGDLLKCDCDPQYLWNYANRIAPSSCDKNLDAFIAQGPPNGATPSPTSRPSTAASSTSAVSSSATSASTAASTASSSATSASTASSSAATTRTASSTSASSTTSSPTSAPTTRAPTSAPTTSSPTSAPTTSSPTSASTRSPSSTSSPSVSPTGSPTGSSSATSASSATTDGPSSAPTTSSPAPTTSAPTASTIDVGQSSGSMVVASVISALLVSLVCLA